MSKRKPAITRQLKHRLDPDLYVAVAKRAEAEHRSISNVVQVALLHYLDRFTDQPTASPMVIDLPGGLGPDPMRRPTRSKRNAPDTDGAR